jgi:dephospho-CoA kinase
MTAGKTLRIGLTGGIASGKSTVSDFLAQMGAAIIDTDKIAREVVQPGSLALQAISERYGGAILNDDGSLRRDRLGEIVFASPAEKQWLEALLHPLIKARAAELAQLATEKGVPAVVFDVPLLFESGWNEPVDATWTVYVSPAIQRSRLKLRDGFSDEETKARMDAQWPIVEKAKRADVVINNEGTPAETRQQVEMAWLALRGLDQQ